MTPLLATADPGRFALDWTPVQHLVHLDYDVVHLCLGCRCARDHCLGTAQGSGFRGDAARVWNSRRLSRIDRHASSYLQLEAAWSLRTQRGDLGEVAIEKLWSFIMGCGMTFDDGPRSLSIRSERSPVKEVSRLCTATLAKQRSEGEDKRGCQTSCDGLAKVGLVDNRISNPPQTCQSNAAA